MKSKTLFVLAAALSATATNVYAQQMSPQSSDAATATQSDQAAAPASNPSSTVAPKVGDPVYDNAGVVAGSVDSVASQQVVLSTEKGKAAIPIGSLGMGTKGLMINMTKSQLDAAIVAAKSQNPAH